VDDGQTQKHNSATSANRNLSTAYERAHRKRGYRVKNPGVGDVSAGCDRADPPTERPQSGRDPDAHRDAQPQCGAIGDVLSGGDEAPKTFAEPDDPGEPDTPTGTEQAASGRTEIHRECLQLQ
jgi:hypothetical protein